MPNETWAQQQDRQNQGIAQKLYDGELKGAEAFGNQPLDPDSGDPQAKIGFEKKLAYHAQIREDPTALLRMIANEGARIGLSPGILPKQLMNEMIALEREYLKRTIAGNDAYLEELKKALGQ